LTLHSKDIARLIDISAVQTPHGKKEIVELVKYAKEHSFIAVHVLPCWVTFLKSMIFAEDDILIGSPVGFPSGGHRTEIKVAETKQMLIDGVQEIDMMMNVGMLRSANYDYVEDDIRAVVTAAGELPVKVIIETYYLTDDEIKKSCELCINAGAEFIKTSSGWAREGATLKNISLITSFAGDAIKVKAAGGVRDLDTLVKMYKMGVTRFGINVHSSKSIIEECEKMPGKAVHIGIHREQDTTT
jgi:deoxyribose-phosphate aldolase